MHSLWWHWDDGYIMVYTGNHPPMALFHLISACCWEVYFSNLVNYCGLWFSQPKPHIPMIFPLYSHVLVLLLLIISPYMPHNQNCFTLSLWKYRWIHWWIIVSLLVVAIKKRMIIYHSQIISWCGVWMFMDVYGVNPPKYIPSISSSQYLMLRWLIIRLEVRTFWLPWQRGRPMVEPGGAVFYLPKMSVGSIAILTGHVPTIDWILYIGSIMLCIYIYIPIGSMYGIYIYMLT